MAKVEEAVLLPLNGPAPFYLREAEALSCLRDDLYATLIRCRTFRRLRFVSFLGAIDYLIHPNGLPSWRRHTRYQHSIGVGILAEQYAKLKNLDAATEKLIVSAGLLHDIGHGPLSHTLEPIFRRAFSIDHHLATKAGILDGEVGHILSRFGVSPCEVIDLIGGKGRQEFSFLFGGSLNIDTIEAISRSATYVSRSVNVHPGALITRLANDLGRSTSHFDDFWDLKDAVYKYLINSHVGSFTDASCQTYMEKNICDFRVGDFLLSEEGLRKRHPGLFAMLRALRRRLSDAGVNAFRLAHEDKQEVAERVFLIDKGVTLFSPFDLNRRYKQSRQSAQRFPFRIMERAARIDMPDFFG